MKAKMFRLHSYAALITLLPLLIASLSGSVLVFKSEIDQWLMPDRAALPYGDPSPSRQNLNTLKNGIEERYPDYVVASWELFDNGVEADRVYMIKKGSDNWFKIYLDPFANQVLSEPTPLHDDLTDWLLELHYTFLLNDLFSPHSQTGTLIGIVAAFILIFLGLSGLMIYKKFWRHIFRLRWHKPLRVVSGDFHRLIGLWSSPLLLVLGITGLYFNALEYYHETFEHETFEHTEEEHFIIQHKLYNDAIDLEFLLRDSEQQLAGFTPTYLLLPYEPDVQISVFGHQPDRNPFASDYASSVSYDRESGQWLASYSGPQAGAGARVLDSFRELHFGSFAGLASKLLWCGLGFAPALLGLSGLYLWYRRKFTGNRVTFS